MLVGCGVGRDHGQMWRNDAIMHDVEHVKCGAAMLCKMWCDMRDVASTWCDLKCGVEYMECGVMWYNARCGAISIMVRCGKPVCERCWCDMLRNDQCDVECDVVRNNGVVHREYGGVL